MSSSRCSTSRPPKQRRAEEAATPPRRPALDVSRPRHGSRRCRNRLRRNGSKRTDIPGLATKNDGRYVFAPLAKPALPPGALALNSGSNTGENHYVDIRRLLLSAPTKATVDTAYPGAKAWYSTAAFEAGFPTNVTGEANDNGVRRIAATGWTTPDGAHTTIWLLQFPDALAAAKVDGGLVAEVPENFGPESVSDAESEDLVDVFGVADKDTPTTSVTVDHFSSVLKPGGGTEAGQTGRLAHFSIGDTLAVIEMTAPAAVPDVPMNQIVTLQAELLR